MYTAWILMESSIRVGDTDPRRNLHRLPYLYQSACTRMQPHTHRDESEIRVTGERDRCAPTGRLFIIGSEILLHALWGLVKVNADKSTHRHTHTLTDTHTHEDAKTCHGLLSGPHLTLSQREKKQKGAGGGDRCGRTVSEQNETRT